MRTNLAMHKLAEGIGAVLFLMKFEPNSPHLARAAGMEAPRGPDVADAWNTAAAEPERLSAAIDNASCVGNYLDGEDRARYSLSRRAARAVIAGAGNISDDPQGGAPWSESANTAAAETSAALRSGNFDPDAAPMTAEAAVQYQRTRGCPHCFTVQARTNRVCAGCAKALPRLRDRVRSPKLYACDIVAGASYVPKRGNDKTPNYYVVATGTGADGMPARVWWRRATPQGGGVAPSVSTAGEFLALVARRADA